MTSNVFGVWVSLLQKDLIPVPFRSVVNVTAVHDTLSTETKLLITGRESQIPVVVIITLETICGEFLEFSFWSGRLEPME